MTDEELNRLLADRKFLNAIAWRVAWEAFKIILPWLVIAAVSFWVGELVERTFR